MPRAQPPATLDALRAQLDAAAVRRVLLPLAQPVHQPEDLAAALHVPLRSVAAPVLVEADGDRLTAIVPGDRRLDLYKVAAAVGARQIRLYGAGRSRRRQTPPEEARLLSGLPTVLDRSLTRLEYLFSFTGDPLWAIRIGPVELQRAASAQVADIVRPGRAPAAATAPMPAGADEHLGDADDVDGGHDTGAPVRLA